jgi:hypothetical protein
MFSSGEILAQLEGCLAAVVTNPSLTNNPRPGNDNDQIWIANENAFPE